MALFTFKNVEFKDIIKYPDLNIEPRGTTFICGESGSGKSTLLKLLNGVLSPTVGEITYAGKNITEFDPIELRREVLLIGQSVYLFDKSIRDNFYAYYAYRGQDTISGAGMEHYLEICSVNLPLNSMCNVLSGGERQRVFLAINISFGAKVLMLDEPTGALDDKNANTLMQNIMSHCNENEMTLLVVSHDKSIAELYAERVIYLEGGTQHE